MARFYHLGPSLRHHYHNKNLVFIHEGKEISLHGEDDVVVSPPLICSMELQCAVSNNEVEEVYFCKSFLDVLSFSHVVDDSIGSCHFSFE